MKLTRGLKNIIKPYSELEKTFILEVAAILEKNKYSMHLLTRVVLQNNINTLQDY